MFVLVIGVVVFSVLHLIPVLPSVKTHLVAKMGKAYGPFFGTTATLSLLVIILGWHLSDFIDVYEPAIWGRYANMVLTLFGFMCLGIFLFRGNLRQVLRFPLAIGVMFWACGHLLANGDLASLILFGGLGTYGVTYAILSLVNNIRPSTDIRSGHDLLSIIMGLALYGVMVQMHETLIGFPVFVISH